MRDAYALMTNGFNPVLLFDGDQLRVMPDFLVSHELSGCLSAPTAFLTVPLLPAIRKLLGEKAESIPDPNTLPANKVLGRDGDLFVEYSVFLGGPLGFELIHESARTVGTASHESRVSGADE